MSFETLIPATDFCFHHRIEISFLQSLQDYGLIEMTTENEACFLHPDQLGSLEKFVRLHYDLHINLEGLDVVHRLLQRMDDLQKETARLRNRLQFYEGSES